MNFKLFLSVISHVIGCSFNFSDKLLQHIYSVITLNSDSLQTHHNIVELLLFANIGNMPTK